MKLGKEYLKALITIQLLNYQGNSQVNITCSPDIYGALCPGNFCEVNIACVTNCCNSNGRCLGFGAPQLCTDGKSAFFYWWQLLIAILVLIMFIVLFKVCITRYRRDRATQHTNQTSNVQQQQQPLPKTSNETVQPLLSIQAD